MNEIIDEYKLHITCTCGWSGPVTDLKKIDFDQDKVCWICCPDCHPFLLKRLESCDKRPAPLLACGDSAHGVELVNSGNNIVCCVSHAGLVEGRDKLVVRFPDLENREAKCTMCPNIKPSDPQKLAFFTYRGPNSHATTLRCGNCDHHKLKHNDDVWLNNNCPEGFINHSGFGMDEYYCGCRGWS